VGSASGNLLEDVVELRLDFEVDEDIEDEVAKGVYNIQVQAELTADGESAQFSR
jgi:hypothetical protein